MTLLFGSGTLRAKVRTIASLTFQHARNLAAFVALYKSGLALLRAGGGPWPSPPGAPAQPWHALVAGGVGGWLVWANYSSVNFQIVMYLMSRIAIALVRLAAQQRALPWPALNDAPFERVYPWLAAGTWALVMWLFETHPKLLHPSLTSSMVTLYHDANRWQGWRDFVPSPPAAAVIAFMVAQYWYAEGGVGYGLCFASSERCHAGTRARGICSTFARNSNEAKTSRLVACTVSRCAVGSLR